MMMNAQPNLFTRDDTFFGVCEGLGEDLGINSNLLRLALAGMLFWNPAIACGTYVVAGLIVLLSRLIAPNPRPGSTAAEGSEPAVKGADRAENEADAESMPLAA